MNHFQDYWFQTVFLMGDGRWEMGAVNETVWRFDVE